MKLHERLVVRNFGSIHEADITPRDLTVFVGPQATGKSLIAQLLFFMMYMEHVGNFDTTQSDDARKTIIQALESWFGIHELSLYTSNDTLVSWHPDTMNESTKQEVSWNAGQPTINKVLEQRIQSISASMDRNFEKVQHIYIPSGRSLYSYLPPYLSAKPLLRIKQEWPDYMLSFYEQLGFCVANLGRSQIPYTQGQQNNGKHADTTTFLLQHIKRIIKGNIHYTNDSVALTIGDKVFYAQAFAAGQMEIWPFFTIVQDGFISDQRLQYVVFEEPEAHLHPGAQRMVMEMIAVLVNYGVRFVITTHSPYLLYALNNFLMANTVQNAGHPLDSPNTPQTILKPEQVAAYRFSDDGIVRSIFDSEVDLIDATELEKVADDLGAEFATLQDMLYEDDEDEI